MHAEIRGRGRRWTCWIPDSGQMAHSVPLYDKDGNLKATLMVGAPPDSKEIRLVECKAGPFPSKDEAIEYLTYLGFAEVRVNRTMTKTEALAKAREARHG